MDDKNKEPFQRCRFTEGSVTLPEGYREQTVNILMSASPTTPALNISRDVLQHDETFEDYLMRQRDMLQKGLRKYRLLEDVSCSLGEGLIQGRCLRAQYQPDKNQCVYQRQAVFPMPSSGVLIFTLSAVHPLKEEDDALLDACLGSYQHA